jgi:hypothetical protein
VKYQILSKTPDEDGVAFVVETQETIGRKTRKQTHEFRIGRSAFEALSDPAERAAMVRREIELKHAAWLAEITPPAQQDWVPSDEHLPVGVTMGSDTVVPSA